MSMMALEYADCVKKKKEKKKNNLNFHLRISKLSSDTKGILDQITMILPDQ